MFREAHQTTVGFSQLHADFQSNRGGWQAAYATERNQLAKTFFDVSFRASDSKMVSDMAKSKCLLRAFCLARFVELHEEGVRAGDMLSLVAEEVQAVEDWDDVEFLASISPYSTHAGVGPGLDRRFADRPRTCQAFAEQTPAPLQRWVKRAFNYAFNYALYAVKGLALFGFLALVSQLAIKPISLTL